MYKIIGANQTEYGPVSAEQIRQWIAEGRINAQTSAQAMGDTVWKPIASFPEFAGSFPTTQPAPPLPGGTPPPLGSAPHTISPSYTAPSADGRASALNEVSAPAIGLMAVGILGMGDAVLNIVVQIFGITLNSLGNLNGMNDNPQVMRFMQMGTGAVGIVTAVIHIVLGAFIVFGALKMKSLQQHGLALGAAIVALIPCISPCCCLGLPIGIWALLILNKQEVRSYFS